MQYEQCTTVLMQEKKVFNFYILFVITAVTGG